jgi:hypothetical protein
MTLKKQGAFTNPITQLGVNLNTYTSIFSCNISMKNLLAIFRHVLYNLWWIDTLEKMLLKTGVLNMVWPLTKHKCAYRADTVADFN